MGVTDAPTTNFVFSPLADVESALLFEPVPQAAKATVNNTVVAKPKIFHFIPPNFLFDVFFFSQSAFVCCFCQKSPIACKIKTIIKIITVATSVTV